MALDEYPISWEQVGIRNNGFDVFRIAVPGGWMVAVRDANNSQTEVIFIANPDHVWPLTT